MTDDGYGLFPLRKQTVGCMFSLREVLLQHATEGCGWLRQAWDRYGNVTASQPAFFLMPALLDVLYEHDTTLLLVRLVLNRLARDREFLKDR